MDAERLRRMEHAFSGLTGYKYGNSSTYGAS